MKHLIENILLAGLAFLLLVATAYACGHEPEPEPQAVVRKAGW